MHENFTEDEFVSQIEKLGRAAVAAKGTDDYPMCFRKLLEYFRDEYFFYLMLKFGLPLNYLERRLAADVNDYIDPAKEEKFTKVEYCYYYAIKNYDKENKEDRFENVFGNIISNFSTDKNSNSNPFFSYLISNFYLPGRNYAKKEEIKNNRVGGMEPFKGSKEIQAIKKIKDYFGCIPHCKDVSHLQLKDFAEEFGLNAKEIEELLVANDATYAAQKADISESEHYLDTDVYDESDGNEEYLDFPAMELAEDTDDFSSALEVLNRIYDESFLEIHQLIFPDCFTSEYLKYVVADVMARSNDVNSLATTVKTHWNDLLVEDRKKLYASGEYVCISSFIFLWFERARRIITNKMIAEQKGISPVRVSRKYNEAIEVVKNACNREKD